MRNRNLYWVLFREIIGECLGYFPSGNQGDSLGERFGGNLGGNLGCKLWTETNPILKKFFWDFNPGQVDDFH